MRAWPQRRHAHRSSRCSTAWSPRRGAGLPRPAGVQHRRHHVPPARLLGAHRPRPPVDRRRAGAAARSARYSYRDLVRLKVVKSLLDAGVKLQTARKAIDYLREDLGDDWATASLVLDGTNSVLARTDDALIDLVRHGQGVLNIVPLGSHDGGARRRRARARRRDARASPREADHLGVAAPRAGAVRAQLRTAVREAARLLRDHLGVRAAHVRARARPRRQPRAGVHPRLLPARRTTSTSRSPR